MKKSYKTFLYFGSKIKLNQVFWLNTILLILSIILFFIGFFSNFDFNGNSVNWADFNIYNWFNKFNNLSSIAQTLWILVVTGSILFYIETILLIFSIIWLFFYFNRLKDKSSFCWKNIFISKRKEKSSIEILSIISEMGICIALTWVTNFLLGFFWKAFWPQGGSITFGMIYLMIFALRRGFWYGIFAGFVIGILNMLTTTTSFINPYQIFLDYFLSNMSWAFVVCGKWLLKIKSKTSIYLFFIIGPIIAMWLSFISSFMSGYLFFSATNPNSSWNVYLFSFIYNITYAVPSAILCILIFMSSKKQFLMLINYDTTDYFAKKEYLNEKKIKTKGKLHYNETTVI